MKVGELYLSKYKILRVYKETLESCVLLAEHIQLNSYWIIKKLNNVNAETMREVEVLKGVKHRGIPLIVDVFSDEESLVIIREFVEGENLDDYSKNGLVQEEILSIGLKLCSILKFLHEELRSPLIFRDIKPGNIIIMSNGELKLIDFGIARFYKEEKSHDTMYLGTKGFASPEQYGILQSDVRTDVFGLGATLYYLITKSDLGKPPYKVLPFSKFRKDIDPMLENIIIKACEINKNKRFQNIDELEQALDKLVLKEDQVNCLEKLNSLRLKVMSVNGLRLGAGATYAALRMAMYLKHKDVKVCIIDGSEDSALLELEFQEECEVFKESISYQNIPIFTWAQLDKDSLKTMIHRFEDIEVVIIDYGLYELNKYLDFKNSLSECALIGNYIVTRVSPWEIDAFEEFVLSDELESDHKMIINFSSKARFDELQESLDDVRLSWMPYESFDELKEEDVFCSKLFEESEVEFHWPKQKSFLSPSYYKTKLLKRIKS